MGGEFRTVEISKGGHLFGLQQHIVPFLDKTLTDLGKERYLAGYAGVLSSVDEVGGCVDPRAG